MRIHLTPKITKIMSIVALLIGYSFYAFSQQQILITDYGYTPGCRRDAIASVNEALEASKMKDSCIVVFPKGRYDFWQNFTERSTIGLNLENLKNVTIDGSGSEFIFHGNMQIAKIFNCENVTLCNFSIDWEHPYIYQGKYMAATDDYIDIEFDRKEYSYVIEDEHFYMTGEGWKVQPNTTYCNLFDKDTKEVLYGAKDGNNSSLFLEKAEEIAPGIVRFYGKPNFRPESGTFTTLFAGRYMTVGIGIFESKNTLLKDLTIYHSLSHGVLGERSENITMDNASMTINEKKNRVFSAIADASHFINCKGLIKVINCAHTGQGDDFINVHGCYSAVTAISDNYSIIVSTHADVMQPGDEVWFVNPVLCQRSEATTIKSNYPVWKDGKRIGSQITFEKALPKGVHIGDYLENKTWSASMEVRNCKILKHNRARGILVTTPYKVVIEDNYFRSAGTAILLEGDMDFWYESGANGDVTIANNVFEDCLTSGCANGKRSEWGEAIITITPSYFPVDEKSLTFHKNIRIENNVFKTFDNPIVRARSVGGLTFVNNEIIRTYTYKPYAWQKSSFLLNGCRNVTISGNHIDKEYKERLIEIEHMKKSDIKVDKNQHLFIREFDNQRQPVYIDDFKNPTGR